jgi:hypothetical protein
MAWWKASARSSSDSTAARSTSVRAGEVTGMPFQVVTSFAG